MGCRKSQEMCCTSAGAILLYACVSALDAFLGGGCRPRWRFCLSCALAIFLWRRTWLRRLLFVTVTIGGGVIDEGVSTEGTGEVGAGVQTRFGVGWREAGG